MPRPSDLDTKMIKDFDTEINKNSLSKSLIKNFPHIKEVLYAGLYLSLKLKEHISEQDLAKAQFECGKLSFGNDPWDVHLKFINDFLNSKNS